MEKARLFICGILNAGRSGIIYFGIADGNDDKSGFIHGEIIGLDINKHLQDEISKAFQNTLDDHIKSDNGKMTRGGEMDCIQIYFVPVHPDLNQADVSHCIVEIEVKREWKYCADHVYYVEEWDKRTSMKNDIINCFSKFFNL